MKTRIAILGIVLFCLPVIVNAQKSKKQIREKFNAYLTAINNGNYAESMEYLTDEFFEIIPKDQMIAVMENVFNNPEMEIKITDPKILKISENEKIEDKYYALLTYSNLMHMKFNNSEEETEEEISQRANLMKASLEKTFGLENVKLNELTGFFEIYAEKDAYAISKNGKTDWRFVVLEREQKVILEQLLPKELIDRL